MKTTGKYMATEKPPPSYEDVGSQSARSMFQHQLFYRRMLSYRTSHRNSTQPLTKTFKAAYAECDPPSGLMLHYQEGWAVPQAVHIRSVYDKQHCVLYCFL